MLREVQAKKKNGFLIKKHLLTRIFEPMTLPDFNKIVKSIDVVQNSGSGFLLFLYVCLDLVYRFYNFGTKINTSIKLGPES